MTGGISGSDTDMEANIENSMNMETKDAKNMEDDMNLDMNEGADSAEGHCPMCSSRHKKRSEQEQKALMTRLKKIEGQIRGIEKMLENDAYCPDMLVQVSAVTSALNSFGKVLLSSHIHSCVAEDIRSGRDEVIDELCGVLQKMMK